MIAWLITLLFLFVLLRFVRKDWMLAVGWLVFLCPIYLIRLKVFSIPTTPLELGIYFLFFYWLMTSWKSINLKKIIKSNLLFIALLLVVLISALFVSGDKINSLGLWKGWFVDPFLLYLIVSNNLKNKFQILMIYDGFVWLTGLLGLVVVWQIIFGIYWTVDQRASAFFGSANYLAMILVPSLIFVMARMITTRKFRWWEMLFLLLGLLALLASASYIGILTLVLGIFFLSWLIMKGNINVFLTVVLSGLILAGIFFWSQAGTERFQKMVDPTQRSSVSVRVEVWRTALEMISQHPIWGIGLGNFEQQYIVYAPTLFHPPMEWRMLHAHNFYFQSWLELTIFGLVLSLAVIFWWWTSCLAIVKKQKKYWWIYAIMSILICWIVGGLFDTPYYKNDLSMVWWLLLGVAAASRSLTDNVISDQ